MQEVVAWDSPETRVSYAAYRRGALGWFGGGLGCVVLAIGLSAYAVLVLKRPGLGVFIVAAVIFGGIGLITGTGALIRARRFRSALQQAPWRTAELRVAGDHLRLVFADYGDGAADGDGDGAEAEGGRREIDVRLMTTSRWRVRTVVGYRNGEVLLCPMGGGGFVLSTPGMDNLYGLRPLKPQVGRYRP